MNIVTEGQDKDLLAQIDEFRQQAEALEGQLQAREAKASALEELVTQKKERAEELDQLIEERSKQADYFAEAVQREMDSVSGQFTVQINELKDALNTALEENKSSQEKSLRKLSQEVSEKLDSLEYKTEEISEKVHSESVQSYRNTQEILKDLDGHLSDVEDEAIEANKKSGVSVPILILVILNLVAVAAAFLILGGFITLPFI